MIKANALHSWIIKRIRRNRNCIIVVNGSTGSGKTYGSMRLAYELSVLLGTNFTVGTNLDFSFIGLLNKMNMAINAKAGTPYLFEEVGATGGGAASREWQSKTNKFFFSFMQTARAKNQILIFTCPSFAALDKGSRELCHVQLIANGIDYSRKVARFKLYILQVNVSSGKIYFKKLRFIRNGMPNKIDIVEFPLPPEEMVKEYEAKKQEYLNELNKMMAKEMKKDQDKKNKVFGGTKIDYDVMDSLIGSKRFTEAEISRKCNCSIPAVQKRKATLKENIKNHTNTLKNAVISLRNGGFERINAV